MTTEILLLLALILLNGWFAMSEIAVVSSRRVRLLQLAEEGNTGARRAVQLAGEPTRFLSTVQVGMTSIGILSGAIGEATIASRLRLAMEQMPLLAPYAQTLALVVMVVGLTYVSLIIGELVPKRLALTSPERIASLISGPMQALAIAARPVVLLLSFSTDTVVRVLRVPRVKEPAVTVEEFKVLIEQGAEEGVLEKTEQELVGNVLRLDERRVSGIMTSRSDVFYLDIRESFDRNRVRLSEAPHSVIPLCEGGMEHVIGFVKSTDVLVHLLRGETIDLKGLATPALFVPATTTLMRLLEQFRRAHVPVALVIDEYGEVDGLVSLGDVVEAIVGDLPPEPGEDPMVTRRDDGSWLIDGRLDIDGLRRALESDRFGDEDQRQYHTAGGLAMAALERVPRIGDAFERDGFRFEIVDMDGNRVDRLLVTRVTGVQKR